LPLRCEVHPTPASRTNPAVLKEAHRSVDRSSSVPCSLPAWWTATCVIATPARTPPQDFEDLTLHRDSFQPAYMRGLVVVSGPFSPCISRRVCRNFTPLQYCQMHILARTWNRIAQVANQSPRSLYPSSSTFLPFNHSLHDMSFVLRVLTTQSAKRYYLN
jgi:hypothetical protein